MAHIQTRYMEAAVADFRGQYFGQRLHTAFFHFALFFNDQGHSPHTDDHAVAAAIKRQSRFRYVGLRCSGAGS